MKLSQTRNGKIVVVRLTRNGSHERIGVLNTRLSLKEAKAAYHDQLEDIEVSFRDKPDARKKMGLAVAGLNLYIEANEVLTGKERFFEKTERLNK